MHLSFERTGPFVVWVALVSALLTTSLNKQVCCLPLNSTQPVSAAVSNQSMTSQEFTNQSSVLDVTDDTKLAQSNAGRNHMRNRPKQLMISTNGPQLSRNDNIQQPALFAASEHPPATLSYSASANTPKTHAIQAMKDTHISVEGSGMGPPSQNKSHRQRLDDTEDSDDDADDDDYDYKEPTETGSGRNQNPITTKKPDLVPTHSDTLMRPATDFYSPFRPPPNSETDNAQIKPKKPISSPSTQPTSAPVPPSFSSPTQTLTTRPYTVADATNKSTPGNTQFVSNISTRPSSAPKNKTDTDYDYEDDSEDEEMEEGSVFEDSEPEDSTAIRNNSTQHVTLPTSAPSHADVTKLQPSNKPRPNISSSTILDRKPAESSSVRPLVETVRPVKPLGTSKPVMTPESEVTSPASSKRPSSLGANDHDPDDMEDDDDDDDDDMDEDDDLDDGIRDDSRDRDSQSKVTTHSSLIIKPSSSHNEKSQLKPTISPINLSHTSNTLVPTTTSALLNSSQNNAIIKDPITIAKPSTTTTPSPGIAASKSVANNWIHFHDKSSTIMGPNEPSIANTAPASQVVNFMTTSGPPRAFENKESPNIQRVTTPTITMPPISFLPPTTTPAPLKPPTFVPTLHPSYRPAPTTNILSNDISAAPKRYNADDSLSRQIYDKAIEVYHGADKTIRATIDAVWPPSVNLGQSTFEPLMAQPLFFMRKYTRQ